MEYSTNIPIWQHLAAFPKTSSDTFNGVVGAQLSEAHVDQGIDEEASRFRERNVPHLWFLNVDSRPPNLEQLLLAHGGAGLREGVGMAVDLSAIASPVPPPPDVAVERSAPPPKPSLIFIH